jgi:hypothetical protein
MSDLITSLAPKCLFMVVVLYPAGVAGSSLVLDFFRELRSFSSAPCRPLRRLLRGFCRNSRVIEHAFANSLRIWHAVFAQNFRYRTRGGHKLQSQLLQRMDLCRVGWLQQVSEFLCRKRNIIEMTVHRVQRRERGNNLGLSLMKAARFRQLAPHQNAERISQCPDSLAPHQNAERISLGPGSRLHRIKRRPCARVWDFGKLGNFVQSRI